MSPRVKAKTYPTKMCSGIDKQYFRDETITPGVEPSRNSTTTTDTRTQEIIKVPSYRLVSSQGLFGEVIVQSALPITCPMVVNTNKSWTLQLLTHTFG